MTAPERLTNEHVAWRCAYAGGADPVLSDMAILALEVLASRRLAPMHAAAVELADYVSHGVKDGDHLTLHVTHPGREAGAMLTGIGPMALAYRAARRALEPQPDEAERCVPLNVAESNLLGRFDEKEAKAIREYVAAALRGWRA